MESDRDMGNSCNANLSTNQNKITQTCELNNNRKRRQDRAAYMRQYRITNVSQEKMAKHNEYQRNYRTRTASPDEKVKRNEYQRSYRTTNASHGKKAKWNEYQQNYRASSLSMESTITKFHQIVSQGPLYVCTCCDQLWYKHSVTNADQIRQAISDIIKYLNNKKSVDSKEWVCRTCHSYLVKNKVPPCAVANGMVFPEKPEFFDLNELECRLLAPRIAFQKLMQAPRGRQLKVHGNIVNVPADVTHTVSLLPRLQSHTGTIKVNLKRKLQYKSSALSLNVRPHKVVQAAKWLIDNSNLYRDEGIVFDDDWVNKYNVEIVQDENDDNEIGNPQLESVNKNNDNNDSDRVDKADDWSEDEAKILAGVTDTMFTATDFLEDNEKQHILNVAPAEGNRPLSVFMDKYCEELAYPGIFLGQARPESNQRKVKVNYSDICKSELRRSDRRAAMCVENIFYKAKTLQLKILLGKSHVALRKCKGNDRNITAGQIKQQGALNRLIQHDEGYKFLNALRGSPPYFEKAKKDLFAMIRQLGPATLFCSFSSAETQWLHLIRILGQLVDHK